jgi:hypothetical protein
MPAHQHLTTQQGKGKVKAKGDRIPILSNLSLESRIAESDPKSPKKPKWSKRLLQKLISPPRELTDEDYTLYIGKPTEKAWVKFRPGSDPYVLILHGNKSSSCEWWYLEHEEIPRELDREKGEKWSVEGLEVNVVYEYGATEQWVCSNHLYRTRVGTVSSGKRGVFDRICLAVGVVEDGEAFVRHALNCAVDNGVLDNHDVYVSLHRMDMRNGWRNEWYARAPVLF